MMKRGKQHIKSHMTLEYEFTGIRIQESSLTPVTWNLTVKLAALGKSGVEKEMSEINAGLTYQRLYFWLDANLPDVVVVNVENEDDLYIANLSANITMYCPGHTGDDMVIQLLHSKLSSLAGDNLIIGEMHLKGDDTNLQYTFDTINKDYDLPAQTTYYPEGSTRDKIPWWYRNDGFCFEFVMPEDSQMSQEEMFKDIFDPMTEFERIIMEESSTHISMMKEPARIVQVEKWKPKMV